MYVLAAAPLIGVVVDAEALEHTEDEAENDLDITIKSPSAHLASSAGSDSGAIDGAAAAATLPSKALVWSQKSRTDTKATTIIFVTRTMVICFDWILFEAPRILILKILNVVQMIKETKV